MIVNKKNLYVIEEQASVEQIEIGVEHRPLLVSFVVSKKQARDADDLFYAAQWRVDEADRLELRFSSVGVDLLQPFSGQLTVGKMIRAIGVFDDCEFTASCHALDGSLIHETKGEICVLNSELTQLLKSSHGDWPNDHQMAAALSTRQSLHEPIFLSLPPIREQRLLVSACGHGAIFPRLLRYQPTSIIGTDGDEFAAAFAQRRFAALPQVKVYHSPTGAQLPADFDIVISQYGLEQFPRNKQAGYLNLLANTVKPGGHLVIAIANQLSPIDMEQGVDFFHLLPIGLRREMYAHLTWRAERGCYSAARLQSLKGLVNREKLSLEALEGILPRNLTVQKITKYCGNIGPTDSPYCDQIAISLCKSAAGGDA